MRTRIRYSKEFKSAIIKKLLSRGNQRLEDFAKENNLGKSTISKWLSNHANVPGMKNNKNSSAYSAEKILKIISETYSLSEEELGLYLRKNGLHTNQLTEWRAEILTSMTKPKLNLNKKDERDDKIKSLEKNLRKKDAALAEVSALLILQKKANLLWPSPSEDEGT